MRIEFFPSISRGSADYGWLKTNYSFSFGDYYDQKRMGFGALRVINDDIISGGFGFDTHPHKNMEIITIPLFGELSHKDSEGNVHTIKQNDVQVMSAGTGIMHSEFNNSKKECGLFQIWINPKEKNISPNYDQKSFSSKDFKNNLCLVASGEKSKSSLYIHQDAKVMFGDFEKKQTHKLTLKQGQGAFVMCVEGELEIEKQILKKRDSVEITSVKEFSILSKLDSKILVIIVPLK